MQLIERVPLSRVGCEVTDQGVLRNIPAELLWQRRRTDKTCNETLMHVVN
jgi:hypothetical protein